MKTTVHIKSIEVLGGDTFFKVEIFHNGEVVNETIVAETMEELIKRPNVEITYDEEFATEEGNTIEEIIYDLDMSDAEVSDFETDGKFDVYLHKVTAKHGEVSYNADGEFVGTYKTEKTANKKALQIANKIR